MNIRRDNTGIAYRAGAPLDEAVPAFFYRLFCLRAKWRFRVVEFCRSIIYSDFFSIFV